MHDAFCRCGRGQGIRITRRKGLAALLGAGARRRLRGRAGRRFWCRAPPDAAATGGRGIHAARHSRGREGGISRSGAVIVRDGAAIATGRNLGKSNDDPTAHAEMVALRQLIAAGATGKLKGATLYASGEPCPMCMGVIIWCGIGRVVFAALIAELATKIGQIIVTTAQLAEATPFTTIAITGGVLAPESLALFKG